jgi:hypothetical protein
MGLLFFSFGIDICAFDGTGEVEDGKHLRSDVLGERDKGEDWEQELRIGFVRIVNCTEPV